MGYKMLLVASLLCILSLANASSVPFITPCTASDNTCAKASGNKAVPIFASGLPDFDVEQLDPVHFDKVDSNLSDLKLILTDITVLGLKNCKITKLERDATTSKMSLTLECSPKLDGQYEINGNLLGFPMSGKGKIHVALDKALFHVDFEMDTKTGADGEQYWHIKRFHHNYDLPNKSEVMFEKLFQDNEVISQAANNLIQNDGSSVVKEIGNDMIVATITRIVENINRLFKKVPVKYLSRD